MGCGIVKQFLDIVHGVCCWACFLRCERAQDSEYCAVYRSRILEDCATHLLDEFLFRLVKEGGVVLLFGVLSCHTVFWVNVRVGLILGCPWAGMFEARQYVFNVPWHGDVYFLFVVIPVYCEPNVLCACPVLGYFVFFLEGVHEVFGVLHVHIFNPKIVHP